MRRLGLSSRTCGGGRRGRAEAGGGDPGAPRAPGARAARTGEEPRASWAGTDAPGKR